MTLRLVSRTSRFAAWLLLLLVLSPVSWSQTPTTPAAIALKGDQQVLTLDGKAQYWVDDTGQSTVAQLAAISPNWQPYQSGLVVALHQKKFWLRFTVDGSEASQMWWLDLKQPWLDKVNVYVQDTGGQWIAKRAGDMYPRSQWSHVARTPRIQLPVTSGVHTYYLSIEHARASYPARMSLQSEAYVNRYSLFEELFFGLCMGVALMVVALATSLAWAWRDGLLARFSLYFLLASLTVMSRMGLNSLLLWPQWPELNAWMGRLLPLLGLASALWFMQGVMRRDEYMPRLERMLTALAVFAVTLGLIEALVPTMPGFHATQAFALGFGAVMVLVFIFALRRGNRYTRLISLGMLPIVAASVFVVMRNAGVHPAGYEIGQFATIAGIALQTPIVLYALIRQSQELREQRVHAGNIDRVDALTGLSTRGVLEFNLKGSLARATLNKQSFMLMLVQLTNHQAIAERHGPETAHQAMQTVAGLLRQLRRGVDTAAVVDSSTCALLLEQSIHPHGAIQTATALLARSLQPSKSLPNDLQLKLRISLATLPEVDVGYLVGDQAGDCITWMVKAAAERPQDSKKSILHLNF